MNKKEKIKQLKSKRGITLISLVVTIIVLIILAAVSISLMLGENGIITKSRDAARRTEEAKLNEEVATNELMEQWDGLVGGSSNTSTPEIPQDAKTVEEMKVIKDNYMTAKTILKDSNGNKVVVPEGFKIAEDSGINVTEGIVIEDNDIIEGVGNNRGNQYVWIPVGKNIKKSDGTTVNITLGRYIFADGENQKDEQGKVIDIGTPILKQSAENYEDETGIHISEIDPTSINDYEYKELKINKKGVSSIDFDGFNTTALDLKGFIDSVKTNGGYYIARYEASYGEDGKANSKVSIKSPAIATNDKKTEGMLWNFADQTVAAERSRGLYEKVTTDLMNSYAWDTAIVYIQEFSGNTDYSYEISKNTEIANTGVNGDEVCKIHDMASNAFEWTTEHSTHVSSSEVVYFTYRGGAYINNSYYTYYMSDRRCKKAFPNYSYTGFRFTLYM